jgi:hypothetical protein
MRQFALMLYFVSVSLVCRVVLAGEIIMDTRARNKTPQVELIQPASAVLMDIGEEDIFPQHGDDSVLDDKAHAMREGVKNRQSNGATVSDNELRSGTDFSDSAAANVSKARAYMKNPASRRIAELPVVSCDNVNNVTGRIGDDSQSGSVITVWMNGKQVQARCK